MELFVLTEYIFLWVSSDSNRRPKVYETFALKPAELHTRCGAGGRIGYLHDVHFGYTTFLKLRDVLMFTTQRESSFRHSGMLLG